MVNFKKLYRKSKPYSRKLYKAIGLKNPMKKGKLSSSRLVKDVMKLKELINVEKKRNETSNTVGTPILLGQVNGNASGAQIVDITPIVSAGTGNDARTGNVLKLTSFYHRYQIGQQGSNTKQGRIIIEYWKVKGNNLPANSATLDKLFNNNVFMAGGIAGSYVDYNSSRNPDYFNDFIPLARKKIYMKSDSTTSDLVNQTFAISKKFSHHIRYDPGTSNVISGQILMTIRCDVGNRSTTVAYTDTGSVIEAQISSGYTLQYNHINYYVDN